MPGETSVPRRFMDFMELMKKQPMTRADLARKAGIDKDTADRWVKMLEQGGFIAEAGRIDIEGRLGPKVRQFAVSREWGGQA